MTVLGGARHVQQNGSVRDPFRRANQHKPFAGVRPLNRVEAQHRSVTGLRATVLKRKQRETCVVNEFDTGVPGVCQVFVT